MLSGEQFRVLSLIQDLQQTSTESAAAAQSEIVCQKLLELQDQAEAAKYLLDSLPPHRQAAESIRVAQELDFVSIGYRRLRHAQLLALEARRRQWQNAQQQTEMVSLEKITNSKDSNVSNNESIEDGSADGSADGSFHDDVHVAKSENITSTLRRIHQLAQGEVLKSELNVSELDVSSKTMRDLQDRYSGVDVLLTGSKKLIQVLDDADSWDRKCMLASLSFLGAVVLWIFWRRILRGPVLLLLWGILRLVGVAKFVSSPILSSPEASKENMVFATLDADTTGININAFSTVTETIETAAATASQLVKEYL